MSVGTAYEEYLRQHQMSIMQAQYANVLGGLGQAIGYDPCKQSNPPVDLPKETKPKSNPVLLLLEV